MLAACVYRHVFTLSSSTTHSELFLKVLRHLR